MILSETGKGERKERDEMCVALTLYFPYIAIIKSWKVDIFPYALHNLGTHTRFVGRRSAHDDNNGLHNTI